MHHAHSTAAEIRRQVDDLRVRNMMRRFFLRALYLAVPAAAKKAHLDKLIADYNRRFESVVNVGENTVCYDRETWNGIREAFSKIIRAVE